jgi:general secretion pathway protein N
MKGAAYAIVFFLLLLAAIATVAPATLIDARLARATDGRLRLADAEGPWWRGRGTLTDAAGTWRVPMAWRVVPAQLAAGQLGIEWIADAGMTKPRGRVDAGPNSVVLADVELRVPAQALGTFARQLDGTAFGGTLQIKLPRFVWRDNEGSGTIDLRWNDARIAAPAGFVNLGTVALPLSARGTGVTGPLEAVGGDLRVTGTVTAGGGGASLDATLTPAPGAPGEIARALVALGSPYACGAVRIAWRSGPR